MTLKSHAKFEEKLNCGLENDMSNLTNFHQSTWKCQKWYFHWILLPKVGNTWTKNLQVQRKYRGVIFDTTQGWYKIWRKTDLCFHKWHEGFSKFSPDYLKSPDHWKCMSLNFTGELFVMTMMIDANIEEGIYLSVQN